MCEYCENNKSLEANIGLTKHFIINTAIQIIDKNKLVSQTIVQWADGLTNPPIRTETKINFCPMCGRELTEKRIEMYQAIYKCRLCGKEYLGHSTGNKNVAMDCVHKIMRKEYFYPKGSEMGLDRFDIHNCEDDSFGFADFQGFKKAEVSSHD